MSVKIDKIREALHTQPFQPFWIYMADGGKIPVEHEDFVALGPTGREMIVFLGDNTHQVVDVAMVTRLAMRSRNGLRTRKKS